MTTNPAQELGEVFAKLLKDFEAGKFEKMGIYAPVIPPTEVFDNVDTLKKDLCIKFPELRETMSYMNMVDELGRIAMSKGNSVVGYPANFCVVPLNQPGGIGMKALSNNTADSGNTAMGKEMLVDAKGASPGWLCISSDGSPGYSNSAPSTPLYVKENDSWWFMENSKKETKRDLQLSDEDILRMGGPLSIRARKSLDLSLVLVHFKNAESTSKHFYARRAGWKEGMRVTYRVNNGTPMLFCVRVMARKVLGRRHRLNFLFLTGNSTSRLQFSYRTPTMPIC